MLPMFVVVKGGGWYSKVRWQRSAGIVLRNDSQPADAEDIAANIDSISDFSSEPTYPTEPSDGIHLI